MFFFLGWGRSVKYVTFYQVYALKGAVIYKVVTGRHYHTGRQSSRSINKSKLSLYEHCSVGSYTVSGLKAEQVMGDSKKCRCTCLLGFYQVVAMVLSNHVVASVLLGGCYGRVVKFLGCIRWLL